MVKKDIIRADKDKIINQYQNDMQVSEIASGYSVALSTIYRYLKEWGIPLKRIAWNNQVKAKPRKHWKLMKSKELVAKMKENTRINNDKITYISFKNATEDQRLVKNIISHPLFY